MHKIVSVSYTHLGIGVPQDLSQAASWYQEAANDGLEVAQLQLGYFYEAGEGVEQNEEMAVYWYQQASNQNYAPAHCYLAYCYEMGIGVEQDVEKAKELYLRSEMCIRDRLE